MVLIGRTAQKRSIGIPLRTLEAYGPGPGHYSNQNVSQGPAAVIGSEPRQRSLRRRPGPTEYYPQELGRKTAPAYSLGASWRDIEPRPIHQLGPGPGAYGMGPEFAETNMKYSIRALVSEKTWKADMSPGPGHFNHERLGDVGYSRRNKRGFGFGSSQREPGSSRITPGPGDYSLSSITCEPKHSISHSISQRRPPVHRPEDVPGPGAYHDPTWPRFGD